MKAIFDERQLLHTPARYFRRGAYMPHPEQAERAILIRDMLRRNAFPIETPRDFGEDPIKAVHDPDYVDFWKDAYERWRAEAPDQEPIPNCHPGPRRGRPSSSVFGQLGWWATDTSVPLTEGTWNAVYWSAQTALETAERVKEGARMVYGLCRPPGHHALSNASNGFCLFNNAAIAAQSLRSHFGKVAVLDIDTHTGNGTLDIFYDRGDVFVCSLHTDPDLYPTYYLGYEDERGEGEGEGATLNLCLKPGSDTETILMRFREGLAALRDFGTEALVVSLGLDMAEDDPLSEVKLTGEGFATMAREIVGLGLPTALIQEGGYLGPSLSKNAEIFLTASRDALASAAD
ncbi:histone deacetylase family protein [Nitratireductor aquimarinus]|nr:MULTISPECIES: histone deacetylase family protein [Alphaproteobacteria]MBY6024107.1 histone deacetylase family protein [Nitratireductor sp. DP7N14-4]MDJ1465240.1 histone deacetylase family protein [Nitratireductor sp. GZWM139]MBN7758821.1 histone deacetylase family protein [Nitratireductor aquimarinus]MBY6001822.1 histone deacetylase family protein [Tritonibacter mobilis]MCV0349656.1 histone deacetylase family protein [Nitratireductor sp.]